VDIERKRIVQHITQAPVAMDCSADAYVDENAFSASSDSALPACAAAWMKMWWCEQLVGWTACCRIRTIRAAFRTRRTQALLHLWWLLAQWFVLLDGLQHQSLGVPIIKRYSKNRLHVNFPLLAENIRGQVLVVHCCQRACSSRAKDHVCTPGKCPNVCGRALLCQAHCELKCADCPASSFAEREWHARDNPDFLLLGREHGFVVAGADSTADADDVAAAGDEAAAEGAADWILAL
jgi:hypothetical protein